MTSDFNIPKVLDISLFNGSSRNLQNTTKYNRLRNIIIQGNDICWLCPKFGSQCTTIDKIFSCSKVKHLTSKLKKEDYYETSI